MTVETATKISQLNALYPPGTDPKSEGDDHLRLIKSVLQACFNDSGTSMVTTLPLALGAQAAQRGFINGLTLANNAGNAANRIDIAIGACATDDPNAPTVMSLTSVLTKDVSVAWAVGNNNGGLDTGTVSASANYHVWLIQRSDTGVVDALFSLSGTAPAMPTSYDRKRRLGIVIRSSSTIGAFRQFNRRVMLLAPVQTRNSTAAATNIQLLFIGTNGVRVRPIFQAAAAVNGSGTCQNQFGDGDMAAIAATVQNAFYGTAGGNDSNIIDGVFITDTAGNLRYSAAVTGAVSSNLIYLHGWYDDVQV